MRQSTNALHERKVKTFFQNNFRISMSFLFWLNGIFKKHDDKISQIEESTWMIFYGKYLYISMKNVIYCQLGITWHTRTFQTYNELCHIEWHDIPSFMWRHGAKTSIMWRQDSLGQKLIRREPFLIKPLTVN